MGGNLFRCGTLAVGGFLRLSALSRDHQRQHCVAEAECDGTTEKHSNRMMR